MTSNAYPMFTPGRLLILSSNLAYSVGAFIADWSPTHVLNPRWPPHAKFHNGQTMSLGVLLALSSTYFAFRPALSNSSGGEETSRPNTRSVSSSATTSAVAAAKEDILHAAVIGSFYCAAGLAAILFPGTAWTDPEFGQGGEQRYIFTAVIFLMWAGYWLEKGRLAGIGGDKGTRGQ